MTYDQSNEFCFYLSGSDTESNLAKVPDGQGVYNSNDNLNQLFELKPLENETYKSK